MRKFLLFLLVAVLLLTGCQGAPSTDPTETTQTTPTTPQTNPPTTVPETVPTVPTDPTAPPEMQTVWLWTEQSYQSTVEGSGSLMTRTFDEAGNLLSSNYASADGKVTYGTSYTYDFLGRVLTEENYYSGLPTVHTEYIYNADGQVDTETFSDGQDNSGTVVYTYGTDGQMKEKLLIQDKMVDHTVYTYDSQGKLLKEEQVVKVLEKVTSTRTVEYTYDDRGNKLSIVNSTGLKQLWTYDEDGKLLTYRELTTDDVLVQGMIYEYDEQNRVLLEYICTENMENPNKKYIYEYDESGVLTVKYICTPNSNRLNASQFVRYTYDENGNLLSEICTDRKNQEVSRREYTYISMEIPVK